MCYLQLDAALDSVSVNPVCEFRKPVESVSNCWLKKILWFFQWIIVSTHSAAIMWNVSFSAILIISQLFVWAIFVYCCYLKCLCVYVVLRALVPPSPWLIDEFELVVSWRGEAAQLWFPSCWSGIRPAFLSTSLTFSFSIRRCWSHPLCIHWLTKPNGISKEFIQTFCHLLILPYLYDFFLGDFFKNFTGCSFPFSYE